MADFRNVILVMTTNAGAADMNKRAIGFTDSDARPDGMEAIRRQFTPEFRNRIDAVIQFESLPFDVILQVVDKFVMELENQLADRNVHIEVSGDAREWLARHGFDPAMGARPMKRVIQEHIKRPLADELLFGNLGEQGGTIRIDVNEAGKGLSLTFDATEVEALPS